MSPVRCSAWFGPAVVPVRLLVFNAIAFVERQLSTVAKLYHIAVQFPVHESVYSGVLPYAVLHAWMDCLEGHSLQPFAGRKSDLRSFLNHCNGDVRLQLVGAFANSTHDGADIDCFMALDVEPTAMRVLLESRQFRWIDGFHGFGSAAV